MRVWLKEIRDFKELSHDEVAELSGISRSYYTHIENGTKTPSVNVAKKIAKALKFKWTRFFKEESSLKKQNTA
ncbi:helix-turn-helix transcriptional regulator [Aneurinibacillus aneurinilyticus]|nr:helix-turn-helix transcriptional regulator [Aneurinibacillus aneurinilyticus]MED0707112.1 helix-turn-helix transcriptional regulator [Aneurinibacillus aneurinilyticus]MED0732819.1 helix-turn-helix transcriptional regulator [Aneurinibacillus aneurinilyticus]MED0740411.1 helix-turn-helix transcriptional regulator [Aneurinibacillus aneurinilyticus]